MHGVKWDVRKFLYFVSFIILLSNYTAVAASQCKYTGSIYCTSTRQYVKKIVNSVIPSIAVYS